LNTLPVGLCGLFSRISLVFGVIAARSSSRSNVYTSAPSGSGRSVTGRVVAPASAIDAW
jgi:hypothetical protein